MSTLARIALLLLIPMTSAIALADTAQAEETVQYRCPEWRKRHEHDNKQANTIVETLTKLKCEVERHEHNGHADIKYRCKDWKSHSMKTHADAHKLEAWLKALGFETKHKH